MEITIICIITIILITAIGFFIIRKVHKLDKKLTDVSRTISYNKKQAEFKSNSLEPNCVLIPDESNMSGLKTLMPKRIKLQNDSTDDSMTLFVEKHLPAKTRQIPLSEDQQKNLYSYISSAAGTGIAVGAQSLAVSGLYRASAAASTLMKYSDGTISSIIREGGKISSHAGFTSAGFTAVAPIAIFQALSAVTGQYYMNIITKQLNQLNESVQKILQKIEAKNKAEITVVQEEIIALANQDHYTVDDSIAIRSYMDKAHILLHNYINQINDNLNGIKLMPDSFWSTHSKEIKKTIEGFNNQDINYLFQMAQQCAETVSSCQLVYLKILCFLSQSSPLYLSKVNAIIQLLKKGDNILQESIDKLNNKYLEINRYIDEKKNDACSYQEKIDKYKTDFNNKIKPLLKDANEQQIR